MGRHILANISELLPSWHLLMPLPEEKKMAKSPLQKPNLTAHSGVCPDSRTQGLEQRPYFYLLYILFYFSSWFFVAPTLVDVIAGIASVIVFSVVYVYAMGRNTPVILAATALALALALGLTPFNGMTGTFAIYAVTLCSSIRPGRLALQAMAGAWVVYVAGSLFIMFGPLEIFLSTFEVGFTAFLAIMAGLAAWSGYNTSERTDIRERRLRLEAELAAVRERERIARDLHDVLGHTLTTIAVKSDLAARLLDSDQDKARQEITEIRDASRATLKEVRAAVAGMHLTTLTAELDRARSALDSANVALSITGTTPALPSQQGSALGLAVREAVTNILRHSEATHASITITHSAEGISLTIEDNGKGETPVPGAGLNGMRSRIEAQGGTLGIGQGAAGVQLRIWLPTQTALEGS